jgi:CRP-like cAMP-binding protein
VFSLCSLPPVASLTPFLEYHTLAVGETVFKLGEPSFCVYILLSGKVSLLIHDQVLSTVCAPNFFGGIGLLDESPRRSGCVVCEQVQFVC